MRYLPKSPADREAMLKAIGVRSVDDLFAPIPAEYRLTRDLNVPRQMAAVDALAPAMRVASVDQEGDAEGIAGARQGDRTIRHVLTRMEGGARQ